MKLKSKTSLKPVMESLEVRQLLSGTGMDLAVLGAAPTDLLAGSAPAVHASQFSHDYGWADSWQQAAGGGTVLTGSGPVMAASPVSGGPAPGSSVTVQVVRGGQTSQLIIAGTNGADTITVTQPSSMSVTVATSQWTRSYSGVFTSVTVYGFGGNDTVRIAYSFGGNANVFGGDGADAVYDDGKGGGTIYGDAGNDTLIAIGGGAKQIYGGAGTDTFWVDGKGSVDATTAENAAGTVHRINQFYGNVSMSLNGQSLSGPALTRYASRYASFASSPLFTDGPTYSDIRQGSVGDCYFLASLASMADTNPDSIRQMITPLGDGTYAVRFYRNGSPVYLRLDASLPVTSGGSLVYARLSASGEMWVPLLEKAYAFFRTGAGSYSSIESGWMGAVYTDVLNRGSTTVYSNATDQQIYSLITNNLSAGRAITAGSYTSASGPIIGSHAYEIKAAYTSGGTMYVTVYNPWGYDAGTSTDSNPNDGLVTLTMAQLKQYFQTFSAMA